MSNQKIVLIFDGDCGFCTTTANYIAKKSKVKIQVVPWQFQDFKGLPVTQEQCADQVYLLVNDKPFGGHEAFAMILKVQSNPVFRVLGTIIKSQALSWIMRPSYRLVAKYRHKLPGGTPACKLPTK